MSANAVLQDILFALNKQQRLAVEFDHTKALQVIAGPGTGKTKVLTSRVAYMMLHHKIKPQDIIVTTFTNKAAKEMIDRLAYMLRDTSIRVSDIMIGTFHSICLKILTRYGHKISLRKDWRIIDEKEIDVIVSDMVDNMPDQIRDYANAITRKVNLCLPKNNGEEWTVHPKLVKKQISRLKAFAILPEEYKSDSLHDPALCYFYEKYQSELAKVNSLDFDDLLMYTFRLLSKERCLPYIQHVLVDEFQDTNGIQMDLMFLFAKGNHHLSRGITVVGDPDQSIYAFRHALAYNFDAMSNKCPIELSQVVLVENYRSSQKILNTSEKLINQQTKGRTHRLPLRAQFDCDFPPVYIDFPAAFLQGASLAKELLYLKALPNLFTYNDFAILVRQRRQIKNIEAALIEHRIPYKIIRGHAFWELKETTAMINLLKCVHSENEKNAVVSSLLYPSRGLGQTSADRLKMAFEHNQGSALSVLRKVANKRIKIDLPPKAITAISEFLEMIKICKKLAEQPLTLGLSDIFDKLYEMSGLRYEYLYVDGKKKSEVNPNDEPNYANSRHKNIEILKNYFLGMENASTATKDSTRNNKEHKPNDTPIDGKKARAAVQKHIRTFFNSLSLYSNESTNNEESEAARLEREEREKRGQVTISTIHGAKGLEWPVVFIPGCDEGIIPSVFGDDDKQPESESEDSASEDIKNNTDAQNAQKRRPDATGDSIDEERRMFFVAQTRAKHLLYLSSVTSTSGTMPSSPSRFLTPDLLQTMVDEQRVFASISNVKMLYKALKHDAPQEPPNFSFDQLVHDYAKFIGNRRERLVWNDSFIRDMYQLDLTQNKVSISTNAFTTAAVQLHLQEQKAVNVTKHVSQTNKPPTQKASPEKTYSHSTMKTSSITKKSFAPQYVPSRKIPGNNSTHKKSFAPTTLPNNTDAVQKSPPSPPKRTLAGSSASSSVALRNDTTINDKTISSRPKIQSSQRKARKVVAAPITLEDKGPISRIKTETSLQLDSSMGSDDSRETTAAEILHDPEDMTIDNRPIIANAKILVDAVRKSNAKSKISSDVKKEGIKQEIPDSSQTDIFSQLSRAKKKAKLNDGEIIVID